MLVRGRSAAFGRAVLRCAEGVAYRRSSGPHSRHAGAASLPSNHREACRSRSVSRQRFSRATAMLRSAGLQPPCRCGAADLPWCLHDSSRASSLQRVGPENPGGPAGYGKINHGPDFAQVLGFTWDLMDHRDFCGPDLGHSRPRQSSHLRQRLLGAPAASWPFASGSGCVQSASLLRLLGGTRS